jgi:hypothetical protein
MASNCDALLQLPGTGRCICGQPYFYEHAADLGVGHFLCHACGRRYRIAGLGDWTPGAVSSEIEPATPVAPIAAAGVETPP